MFPKEYPSLYGDVPPVSTRIISHVLRVLTSFVPSIHNLGVSLAPLQGHALWKIFLPTTGSFLLLTVSMKAPCGGRLPLISTFAGYSVLLLVSPIVAEQNNPFLIALLNRDNRLWFLCFFSFIANAGRCISSSIFVPSYATPLVNII